MSNTVYADTAEHVLFTPFDSVWFPEGKLITNWKLDSTWLRGNDGNAVQSIAFDPEHQRIYALYDSKAEGGVGVIYSVPMKQGDAGTQPVWGADGDVRVGHQGLALETGTNGHIYLWTSKRNRNSFKDKDPDAGAKVLRIDITDVPSYSTERDSHNEWKAHDGRYFKKVQEYTLWPDKNVNQNSQPTISSNGKYLITKRTVENGFKIRVFDFNELKNADGGNFSSDALTQFFIPRNSETISVIQGIASDGRYIYVAGGRFQADPNQNLSILIYDMQGNFIGKKVLGDVGYLFQKNEIKDANMLEDESLNIIKQKDGNHLVVQIAGGSTGHRTEWIYDLCKLED